MRRKVPPLPQTTWGQVRPQAGLQRDERGLRWYPLHSPLKLLFALDEGGGVQASPYIRAFKHLLMPLRGYDFRDGGRGRRRRRERLQPLPGVVAAS